MFLQLASAVQTANPTWTRQQVADYVLGIDVNTLRYWLETGWHASGRSSVALLGSSAPSTYTLAATYGYDSESGIPQLHLIYAYMIEQTVIARIMRRVVWEYVHGERFGVPVSAATQQWLHSTEELFFRDGPFNPVNVASLIRPDPEAARRNAYYRMFGLDLNHGAEQGGAYPYTKPEVANRDFAQTLEDFLREVWQGIENASNSSGPNRTDDAAIQNIAIRLENMLNARRGGTPTSGILARDEFVHVATMSWFSLTVQADTSVVSDLKAGGPSSEQRLKLIGERVGIASHARSQSYFRIAVPLATLLIELELGTYSTPSGAASLYAPGSVQDNLREVITHWSVITGRDIKGQRVAVGPPPIGTPAMPSGTAAAVASGNGRTAAASVS
jgi:hypothetical protein